MLALLAQFVETGTSLRAKSLAVVASDERDAIVRRQRLDGVHLDVIVWDAESTHQDRAPVVVMDARAGHVSTHAIAH